MGFCRERCNVKIKKWGFCGGRGAVQGKEPRNPLEEYINLPSPPRGVASGEGGLLFLFFCFVAVVVVIVCFFVFYPPFLFHSFLSPVIPLSFLYLIIIIITLLQ